MSPIVEASVTEAKLRILLSEKCEAPTLDYKRTLNPNERCDEVELAKDIAAMQCDGGYIVIGANDDGSPSETFHLPADNRFDESVIRNKMEKYFPVTQLLIAAHSIDGHSYILIYVGQNISGITVMSADGAYTRPGRQQDCAFRRGDVFLRNGTSSERWHPKHVAPILERIMQSRKESWRRENVDEMRAALRESIGASHLAHSPAAAFSWDLDVQTMGSTLVELLRSHDEIPARLLLDSTPIELQTVLKELHDSLPSAYIDILDRVTCHLAVAVHLEASALRDRSLRALRNMYQSVHSYNLTPPTQGKSKLVPRMWLEIVSRVEAVGALAVRLEDWASVRSLTLQPPPIDDMKHYSSWTRHALVMCNRADVHHDLEGQESYRSTLLIPLTLRLIADSPYLRPDLPTEDEHILQSVLEFDFLAAMILVTGIAQEGLFPGYYASFAYWDPRRLTSLGERLIQDLEFRRTVLPNCENDQQLADALAHVQQTAHNTVGIMGDWGRWDNTFIATFVRANRSSAE